MLTLPASNLVLNESSDAIGKTLLRLRVLKAPLGRLVDGPNHGLAEPDNCPMIIRPIAAVPQVDVSVGAAECQVEVGHKHLVTVVEVDVHGFEAGHIEEKHQLKKTMLLQSEHMNNSFIVIT